MSRALFPGSFDPVTRGHLDIVARGARLFDSVTVAVAENIDKRAVFSLEERVALLEECLPDLPNLAVCTFSGLLVDFCRANGHDIILRGQRNAGDFQYEYQMAHSNRQLNPDIETVFLMTAPEYSFISSSLIRDIVKNGGDVAAFVPEPVAHSLRQRLGGAES